MDLDRSGDSLEEKRQRVRVDHARPRIRGRSFVGFLQVPFAGIDELEKNLE